MSANELIFRLRSHGIYEVTKVKSGILEQNSQLVIIEVEDIYLGEYINRHLLLTPYPTL